MSTLSQKADQLLCESRSALDELIVRSHAVRGWQLLQERNLEGDATGSLPYTDEALAAFQAALASFPDHVAVIHHLAIGHHARGWDLELQGDSRAAKEWESALGYWRRLASSGEFWAEQKTKLQACDPNASPAILDAARKDLMENLLDIHVDFIRHYFQLDQPGRAIEHVHIIRRAQIPPAVKNRLVDKVFEVMTASVAQALLVQEYESALVPIEQFLTLFPDQPHLGAFRKHAEVCAAWLSRLSWQDDWGTIGQLSQRALPVASLLAAHPELEQQALARTALEQLTGEMALRSHDRAATHFAGLEAGKCTAPEREETAQCLQLSLEWARLGYPYARDSSLVRKLLPVCLHLRAVCLDAAAHAEQEALGAIFSDPIAMLDVDRLRGETATRIASARDLRRKAVEDLTEAVRYEPDNPTLAEHLGVMKSRLDELEFISSSISGGVPDNLPGRWAPDPSRDRKGADNLRAMERGARPKARPGQENPSTADSVTDPVGRALMNIWRGGSLTENPYVRNAFRVARVPREVARRQTLVQYIGQTRAMISADPGAHRIRGESVTHEELNQAEAILLSSDQRILEELLTHATESPQISRLRRLAKEAAAAMAVGQDALGPIDPRILHPMLLDIVRLYLPEIPGAEASLGALELELPPPFGWQEKE